MHTHIIFIYLCVYTQIHIYVKSLFQIYHSFESNISTYICISLATSILRYCILMFYVKEFSFVILIFEMLSLHFVENRTASFRKLLAYKAIHIMGIQPFKFLAQCSLHSQEKQRINFKMIGTEYASSQKGKHKHQQF